MATVYVQHIEDFGPRVVELDAKKREGRDWFVAEAGVEGRLMLEGVHVFKKREDAEEAMANELRIRAARAGQSEEEHMLVLLARHESRAEQAARFAERTRTPLGQ